MIHRASVMAWGNAEDLQKQIDILLTIDNQLAEAYATKSNGKYDKEYFLSKMSEESWFTCDEAYELGLVDEIIDKQVQMVACSDVNKLHFKYTTKLEKLINKVNEEEQTRELLSLYKWLDNLK